jgi:hypothetical protein
VTQIFLHHNSVESQLVHTRPLLAKINRDLELAREKLSHRGTFFSVPNFEEISSYLPRFMRACITPRSTGRRVENSEKGVSTARKWSVLSPAPTSSDA